MGAAAAKQFQTDKAKHAAVVLDAVQNFHEASSPSTNKSNQGGNRSPSGDLNSLGQDQFKKTILAAAADSKRYGKDIDASLMQVNFKVQSYSTLL